MSVAKACCPLLLVLAFIVLPGCSSIDRALENYETEIIVSHNALLVADWLQTREIAVNDKYVEMNKELGYEPTIGEVNKFFIREVALQNAVPLILPRRWRKYWHTFGALYRFDYVQRNHQLGIEFKF